MAKYSGKTVAVGKSAQAIADKFADLTVFGGLLDKLPEDQRAKIGNVTFEPDSIVLETQQVGNIRFRVTERSPKAIVLSPDNSPVPLNMRIDLDEKEPELTDVTTNIDVDIPIFLRPLVGGHLQKAVDQLSELIARLSM